MEQNQYELNYLKLLSISYPSISSAAAEIINLKAILNLPKGTEHFMSDIHGEFDAFVHILKSGSGVIKDKIKENLLDYSEEEQSLLATIIYYPKEKLDYIAKCGGLTNQFYHHTLSGLIEIARISASKYTRSKVRKLISKEFVYIIEELMQSHLFTLNKEEYYKEIINSIIDTGKANDFIEEMAILIQKLSVDHLHILGDIYDRGIGAFRIIELLKSLRSVDITWGNHDICYMGAASGNPACIANVIRTSCRYNHLSTIEDGYGISLRPLVTFALKTYGNDPCLEFIPTSDEAITIEDYDNEVIAKMHKAITIIEFKLEGQLISRHPNYNAEYLKKLEKINFRNYTYSSNGKNYHLIDTFFPTIDKYNPYKLTKEEEELVNKLVTSFKHCKKLQEHTDFLFSNGSMYLHYNDNLLFHGCIPTDENGEFLKYTDELGNSYSGKNYLDYCDHTLRLAYYGNNEDSNYNNALDFFYFLWCVASSPLYGKSDITTFERYFLSEGDRKNFPELKNHYYSYNEDETYCKKILKEFDVDEEKGAIINGHMPVKIKKGESPIKANGRLIIIDGGISKAYQKVTGIAGYTLVSNSYGFKLIAHEIFKSKEHAIEHNQDILHSTTIIHPNAKRRMIKETYNGKKIQQKVQELTALLACYRTGTIKSK